jgi:D-proline reductase (dithiol) PrdB
VGLVARVLEGAGIPTVVISTARDISAQVKAPRTVFVNFPMGNTFGRPFDRVQQRAVLLDALRRLEEARVGGEIIDLRYEWGAEFDLYVGGSGQSANI